MKATIVGKIDIAELVIRQKQSMALTKARKLNALIKTAMKDTKYTVMKKAFIKALKTNK